MLCGCGCGRATKISKHTDKRTGSIRGRPLRFIHGHNSLDRHPGYVVDERGCWNWSGFVHENGYPGGMMVNGVCIHAHRAFYIKRHGPVKAGLQLDHLCRNRRCVNPDHLEAVEPKINVRRGSNAKLTDEDAKKIRTLLDEGRLLKQEIAQKFGVSPSRISDIVHHGAWA